MLSENMDALFYLASQGCYIAQTELHNLLKKKAVVYLGPLFKKHCKTPSIHSDFDDYISDLVLKTVNEYDLERGKFYSFAKKTFEFKLENYLYTAQNKIYSNTYSLDDEVKEGFTYYDVVEDINQRSLNTEIAISNFKYKISTPNKSLTKQQRLVSKVLTLRYAGYSDVEIAKSLNLTIGVLRKIIKQYKNNDELINFKLELK